MAAAAGDYFAKVGSPGTATYLTAGYSTGGTSITVDSTTNWPTDTGVIFAIDEATVVNGEEVQTAGTYNEFEGTVASGTSITNVDWKDGSGDRNYSASSLTRVYIPVSAERENRLVTGLTVEHNQDGTHSDITATTLSLTGNLDMADGQSIRDGNNNELLTFQETASAVNQIDVTNAATGNNPSLSATGDDTNIGMTLTPKGSGLVTVVDPTNLGTQAWQDWTPTWGGVTLGSGADNSKYVQIGKTVIAEAIIDANSTSFTGNVTISNLPVTADTRYASNNITAVGYGSLIDSGTAVFPLKAVFVASSTTIQLRYHTVTGSVVRETQVDNTAPIASVATGDGIHVTLIYEAA